MKVGTKSLLFGVHQIFIHPLWVALAWWKLYSFPWDPRLWVAFFVHDLGYWGLPEMDGKDGDRHVERGAQVMHWLFDHGQEMIILKIGKNADGSGHYRRYFYKRSVWYNFCLYHSRFWAKQKRAQPSRLCMADKYALCLEPWWLYLPRAWASGELAEYMKSAEAGGKHGHMGLQRVSARQWYASVQDYLHKWVMEHKDGKTDTVTQVASCHKDSCGCNG